MNIGLLQQVKARILAEPNAFRMDTWSCGTAHCIGGTALLLVGDPIVNPEDQAWFQHTATGEEAGDAAARVLGLSKEGGNDSEAERLLHEESWPYEFSGKSHEEGVSRAKRAQIAADRIDHFIATGGRE